MRNFSNTIKHVGGLVLARNKTVFAFERCVFLLAHMRSCSTALSYVMCSRREVSGYGEAHIQYGDRNAIGRLALNQFRHGSFKLGADFFFDKILHTRLDETVPPEFFRSRAVFAFREPVSTIHSILQLYESIGRKQYRTVEAAAGYYIERMERLSELWDQFPIDRRCGLTHARLLAQPDYVLGRLSDNLGFNPPLQNTYMRPPQLGSANRGDPLKTMRHDRIVSSVADNSDIKVRAAIAPEILQAAEKSYWALHGRVEKEWPDLV